MKRILLILGVCLAGCTNPEQPLSPSFGQAVNANIAAQVIRPEPVYDGPAVSDGQRINNAIHRYRTNQTFPPHLPLEGGNVYDNGATGNNNGGNNGIDSSSTK